MRKKFIIILLLIIFTVQGCSMDEKNMYDGDTIDIESVNIYSETSEGGVINGVYKGGELIQISAFYYGSMGKNEFLIYFCDNTILINKYIFKYNEPVGVEDTLISSSQMEQYIIVDDEVYLFQGEGKKLVDNVELIAVIDDMILQLNK